MLPRSHAAGIRGLSKQVIANAKALATGLQQAGFRIVSGGTDTHLMLVDVFSKGVRGREAENALDRARITVNKNAIPFDVNPPLNPGGIRLGSPAATTRGFGETEMREVAYWDPRFWPGRSELCAIEIGWTWLAASAQRTGINAEAKLLLFQHAFETLGVVGSTSRPTPATSGPAGPSRAWARSSKGCCDWSPSLAPGEQAAPDSAMFSVIDTDWAAVKAALRRRLVLI